MVEQVGAHGYADVNVRQVLDRAEVSRKTFYELFPTKDDCLLAIYDDAARCLRAVVEHAYRSGVTPRERIDAALDVLLEWTVAEPDLARLCLVEVPSSGVEGQRRLAATLTWLGATMADVLGDLDVPEALPELLVGGVHQMIVQRLIGAPEDLAALSSDVSEIWSELERWAKPSRAA
jgi:TetR/AcrR family transcriptional regulator